MSTWQKIETVPTGVNVLVYCHYGVDGVASYIAVAEKTADGFLSNCLDGDYYGHGFSGTPTHWMPLPEPPQPL